MRFKELSKRLGTIVQNEWFWVVLALFLREAFAVYLGDRRYQADESGFDSQAFHWAFTGTISGPEGPTVTSPVPPVFFGIFYRLFGHALLAPRAAQAALGALTAWMIGRTAKGLFQSERAGLFAVALASVYPFFIYYSGMLLSESLYVFFMTAGLWALCESLSESGSKPWKAAIAGLCLAAGALTRTEGLAIALFLWLFCLVPCALKRYSPKALALGAFCWFLPLLGWAARNKNVAGAYVLDLHGGYTLMHGVIYFDINEMDTLFANQAFHFSELHKKGAALDPLSRDRLYFRAALSWMKDNPAQTVRQWVHKAFNFWRFYPRTDKEYPDTATMKPHASVGRLALVFVSLLFEPAIILGGFWGLWVFRGRFSELFPLYWMLLGTFGVHVIVISQMRYRLPVMPVLMLFFCAAVDRALGHSHLKTEKGPVKLIP